jgi:hypothetical protein
MFAGRNGTPPRTKSEMKKDGRQYVSIVSLLFIALKEGLDSKI